MRYGGDYAHILEAYEMFKDDPSYKVPAAIADRVEVDQFNKKYLDAFFRLGSSRSVGMALGLIPLSEIIIYGQFIGEDDMDAFISIIQSVDAFYLEENNKIQDAKSKK